jgi:23S rRNA (guanine745-N1)-methyltransferase
MKEIGMDCVAHTLWSQQRALAPDAIADALAMTYRAVRHSQRTRLDTVGETTVTMAADLMRFRFASNVS